MPQNIDIQNRKKRSLRKHSLMSTPKKGYIFQDISIFNTTSKKPKRPASRMGKINIKVSLKTENSTTVSDVKYNYSI